MAKVYKVGTVYHARYKNRLGQWRKKSTGRPRKQDALKLANEWEWEEAQIAAGFVDPEAQAIQEESRKPLSIHLESFKDKLRTAGRTEGHVDRTAKHITTIANATGFQTIAAISADKVTKFANDLASGELDGSKRSARTVQAYLTSIKSFTKWLAVGLKLPRDPLAGIQKPNPEKDRKLNRRILSREEWTRLADSTKEGPARYGVDGKERHLLYWTALETGLRSGELRSLRRGLLHLTEVKPFIRCEAGSTKNHKPARQFISRTLATALGTHVGKKMPKAPVFQMPDSTNVARMLRADLKATRTQWIKEAKDDPQELAQREESDFLAVENHSGERLDFHALRHTCGAWLANAGHHPKLVQEVMRHSSITLTMDRYGHLMPGQAESVTDTWEEMAKPAPELKLTATG